MDCPTHTTHTKIYEIALAYRTIVHKYAKKIFLGFVFSHSNSMQSYFVYTDKYNYIFEL